MLSRFALMIPAAGGTGGDNLIRLSPATPGAIVTGSERKLIDVLIKCLRIRSKLLLIGGRLFQNVHQDLREVLVAANSRVLCQAHQNSCKRMAR